MKRRISSSLGKGQMRRRRPRPTVSCPEDRPLVDPKAAGLENVVDSLKIVDDVEGRVNEEQSLPSGVSEGRQMGENRTRRPTSATSCVSESEKTSRKSPGWCEMEAVLLGTTSGKVIFRLRTWRSNRERCTVVGRG